ncbi:MAG: phosphoribosylglycinamide formyltransferase [Actinomycetota bacterium]|nr:phosphoribosylglycinamide formyltransferase [Actinomycetota bacterium]
MSHKPLKRLAVFASGFGSNLGAIIDYMEKNSVNGSLVLVFSNNPKAPALNRAVQHNIKTCVLEPRDYGSREEYDRQIAAVVQENKIDLIILAGYMLLLSSWFVEKYKNRIMNIHPSLLPAFKGMHGIKDAFDWGVKITGVTVHFVDGKLDHGPIILQKEVPVSQSDTLSSLEEKIHKVEHVLYPEAIGYYCQDRLRIKKRKVIITGIEKE